VSDLCQRWRRVQCPFPTRTCSLRLTWTR